MLPRSGLSACLLPWILTFPIRGKRKVQTENWYSQTCVKLPYKQDIFLAFQSEELSVLLSVSKKATTCQ